VARRFPQPETREFHTKTDRVTACRNRGACSVASTDPDASSDFGAVASARSVVVVLCDAPRDLVRFFADSETF
jgi:hypothetical protein